MKPRSLRQLARRALREDVGSDDLTTSLTVSPESRCIASLIAKDDGVLSGMKAFLMVLDEAGADISNWAGKEDGTAFEEGETLAKFEAKTAQLLTGERTALNFLQHLSGIATSAAAYVKAVEATGAQICDTRKTTPGLRALEKEAVRHGGALNHRSGLHDGILIKENHIEAAGGIAKALGKTYQQTHHLMNVEIEVKSVEEAREALEAGADVIMLDNMSLEDMRTAVALAEKKHVTTEASGNVTLDNVRDVAETGVDLISVGALTHSAPAADLSLLIEDASQG